VTVTVAVAVLTRVAADETEGVTVTDADEVDVKSHVGGDDQRLIPSHVRLAIAYPLEQCADDETSDECDG
jgi:hypothetical protein